MTTDDVKQKQTVHVHESIINLYSCSGSRWCITELSWNCTGAIEWTNMSHKWAPLCLWMNSRQPRVYSSPLGANLSLSVLNNWYLIGISFMVSCKGGVSHSHRCYWVTSKWNWHCLLLNLPHGSIHADANISSDPNIVTVRQQTKLHQKPTWGTSGFGTWPFPLLNICRLSGTNYLLNYLLYLNTLYCMHSWSWSSCACNQCHCPGWRC